MKKRILLVSPGDYTFKKYTQDLYDAARVLDSEFEMLEPLFFENVLTSDGRKRLVQAIVAQNPDVVHFQHEYGSLGSKVPLRYQFPALAKELRKQLPRAKLLATAHTVIQDSFRYPVRGRGWQAPLRAFVNVAALPLLKKLWGAMTWGALDAVIVHSRHQLEAVQSCGSPLLEVIPHYVPEKYRYSEDESLGAHVKEALNDPRPAAIVFGYFTPEKGQDIVIRAMPLVLARKPEARLILAGGLRREADRTYYEHCQQLIKSLGLESSIRVTGFVNWRELDALSKQARFAIIPFRETSGSGSLVDLLVRGMPVLASDLPINTEIEERAPGVLRCFHSEDLKDCAEGMLKLFVSDEAQLAIMRKAAKSYTQVNSAQTIALKHLDFYRRF